MFLSSRNDDNTLSQKWYIFEPPHDKTNKVVVRLAKTQISLGNHPVWSESSLSAWRNLESLATQWAHSEDSDQTGRMPRLIWAFAGRTLTLLVLSRGGSFTTCRHIQYTGYRQTYANIDINGSILYYANTFYDRSSVLSNFKQYSKKGSG